MSSLHVGTITFDWYPADPRVRRLAEAAASAGHDVDVLCLRQPDEKRYEVFNDVRIYRMRMNRGVGRSLPMTIGGWCWFLLQAGLIITRLHLKRAYDVIHVHNMPDFLVFATLLPRLLGAKIILDVQDVSPELMGAKAKGRGRRVVMMLARWQEYVSVKYSHHVVTVGWPFEERLLQRGVPRRKLSVLINSVDPRLFPAAKREQRGSSTPGEEQPFILMYHGTLAERNGLDTAIRAFALARAIVPAIRFDIQGRGEHLPFLKQLAKELGVEDSVIFTGPTPFEQVVDFVAHGDVGLIPYRCDDFMQLVLPTKAYELAWMHRPMIASNTLAIRSMFRPESIVLCDPLKPEEFCEAIVDLYQHPEKRAKLIENAAADYQPYQWEPVARSYQQLLASLANKGGSRKKSVPTISDVATNSLSSTGQFEEMQAEAFLQHSAPGSRGGEQA